MSKERLFFKTNERRPYSVEVYNGKSLIEVITVQAGSNEDASKKALNVFFEDINVKIKKHYG